MKLPRRRGRQFCVILLLAWLTLPLCPARALALSARDLVVVYNRNLPDSRAVATYYAEQRQVPPDNLVGVDVPASEDLNRRDYDRKLVPPVKAQVERLKTRGATPAILLVYGIPLRVGIAPMAVAEMELKTMAAAKVKENQTQALRLIQNLERLSGATAAPLQLTSPTPEFLRNCQEALQQAQEFLRKLPATPEADQTRSGITALIVKLAGTSPEARSLMARAARRQSPRQAIRQRELLGSHTDTLEDMEQRMFRGILPGPAKQTAAHIRESHGLLGELKFWYEVQQVYGNPRSEAAVDSELPLIIAGPYQKNGWLPNPFNLAFNRFSFINEVRSTTVMVGRLDGPTPAIARRLVDDAMAAEETGLDGTFYIDARGLAGKGVVGSHVWFDEHLLHLAELLGKYAKMKVVLDKQPAVFPPDACPDAALYCGWYSLRQYVPAFKWKRGAVGYHVASYEASTLKQPGSNVWCKRMLEEGVAATLGPVNEPYLFSFPLPDQFFPLLMTGKLTLLEVYFSTVPQISWMQILIGDPLYRPFKNKPVIPVSRGQDGGHPGKP